MPHSMDDCTAVINVPFYLENLVVQSCIYWKVDPYNNTQVIQPVFKLIWRAGKTSGVTVHPWGNHAGNW